MVYLVFQYYCYTCVASYIVANYVLIYYNTLRLIRPRKVSKLEKPSLKTYTMERWDEWDQWWNEDVRAFGICIIGVWLR